MAHKDKRPIIVGIAGAAGAGKSFLAQYLHEHHGFVRFSFADTLKKMLRAALEDYGYNELEIVSWMEGDRKEERCPALVNVSCRYAMQTLGTEWGRERIHPRLWLNLLGARLDGHQRVVVDDVRMANEADYIYSLSPTAYVFRVMPIGEKPRHPGSHSSEVPLDRSLITADLVHDFTYRSMKEQVHKKLLPVVFPDA
jgi:hypothetical protein